jgi:hypothetical protein
MLVASVSVVGQNLREATFGEAISYAQIHCLSHPDGLYTEQTFNGPTGWPRIDANGLPRHLSQWCSDSLRAAMLDVPNEEFNFF